ncbi:MAG: hypothetical protein U1D55_10575 [Phycisphaerae bacterium]
MDFAADGRAIGVEITARTRVTLDELNHVLAALNETPVASADLRPLHAA